MRQKKQKSLLTKALIISLIFLKPCSTFGYIGEPFSETILKTVAIGAGAIGAASALFFAGFHKSTAEPGVEAPSPPAEGTLESLPIIFTESGKFVTHKITNTDAEHSVTQVDKPTLSTSIHGVTIIGNSCENTVIAPGGSCEVRFYVTADAYGNGELVIDYANNKKTIQSSVSVTGINLDLKWTASNPPDPSQTFPVSILPTDPILLPHTDPTDAITLTYTLTNRTGSQFNWHNKDGENNKVAWNETFDPFEGNDQYYVELDLDTCAGTTPISPGNSCTFKLIYKHAHEGDWAKLNFMGANLANYPSGKRIQDAYTSNGLIIVQNDNLDDYHLGYRSIKLVNTMPTGQSYGNIAITTVWAQQYDIEKLLQCAPGDVSCAYTNNCPSNHFPLLPGPENACLIWFKALDSRSIQTDPRNDNWGIYVEVTGTKFTQTGEEPLNSYERISAFTTLYENSVYAGGDFTKPNGSASNTNKIAKWNGTAWTDLASGLNGSVLAIEALNGDLYAGGSFTDTTNAACTNCNYIAKWSGNNWSPLGTGLDATARALKIIPPNNYLHSDVTESIEPNKLFVGGDFANRVIYWNDKLKNWGQIPPNGSPPTWPVYALQYEFHPAYQSIPDYYTLYAAGGDSASTPYIVKYSKDTDNWVSLPSIYSPGPIYALSLNFGSVFVGGKFAITMDSPPICNSGYGNVGMYNGDINIWLDLGTSLFTCPDTIVSEIVRGVSDTVFSLAYNKINENIYAGGGFMMGARTSTQEPGTVNLVSKIDLGQGTGWQSLSNGISTDPTHSVKALFAQDERIGSIDKSVLYAGGNFAYNADGNCNNCKNIAKYIDETGGTWTSLGAGLDGSVNAIITTPSLVITGYFPAP